MLKSGTVSRGRYLIILGGSTASVEESLNEALTLGTGQPRSTKPSSRTSRPAP